MKNIFFTILILSFQISLLHSQTTINVNVNASSTIGSIPPIWRDHYENHLLHGYGGNPSLTGTHTSFVSDPDFISEMNILEPRFIRISIGRADNPPDTNYYSSNTNILKNLPYEFYKGGNNLTDANNLSYYDFWYIDSMITLVQSIGAEPFLTLDYMPFNLSSDTIPNYQPAMALVYNLAYDNSIRNAPPSNNAVYGRVMYQLIKHCYNSFGVTYFEFWNEPDQQWANPIMVKFFWTGDEYQLYDAYAAIANEVSADINFASNVKLGGCSFALYSFFNLIPIRFLQLVQTNSTKFDFLSFHPYSDIQFKGGYDSAKVALVQSWKDAYVPSAELINAEWGRIDQNTNTWGDLDYGLNKIEHIIDMLNRNVSMSFEVALFDQETSTDNYTYLGMYRVGPIVPKPSAYVFYNMNKMNDALNRLPLTVNTGMYGLAGINNAADKIVIAFPAPNPVSGNNEIHLNVSNLPWGTGTYYVNRFELTDQSYQLGVINNLTQSSTESGGIFSDTIVYPSLNNSGRFIIWELSSHPLSIAESATTNPEFSIYPNPATDNINIQFKEKPIKEYSISIMNTLGSEVYFEKVNNLETNHIIRPELNNGFYIISISLNGKTYTDKIIIN
ncbi:hypothetical protein BH09BAC5_BH09BAC5_13460 [soil metagenome]